MLYDLLWDRSFASANRLIKDSHPYQIIDEGNKKIIIINALGIAEEDIKVDVKVETYSNTKKYLYVEGETKNEIAGTTYSFSNRFSFDSSKVEEIKYNCKDGLLYIELFYKEEPVREIPISRK